MKKVLLLIATAILALSGCREKVEPVYVDSLGNFNDATAKFYGDFYGNGTHNYFLTLFSGYMDDNYELLGAGRYVSFELNVPASPALGIPAGTYTPQKNERYPEYTYLKGYRGGLDENLGIISGSYVFTYEGSSDVPSVMMITDGSIRVAYAGNRLLVNGIIVADGHEYELRYEGNVYALDMRTPDVPTNPVLNRLNDCEAVNYGKNYNNVNADDWWFCLYSEDFDDTKECVEFEILAPAGSTTLPTGTYRIENEVIAPGMGVYGWVNDDNTFGGTWYCYGGYATYGATEGYVNITAVGDRYTIDFSCYDGVEENSFSGRFSGGIRYFEPSDFAVAKSCSVKTKSGDVLVSTAHVRDGKHVGSRRLARIPQPSRQ
jgi:hypothetical protein